MITMYYNKTSNLLAHGGPESSTNSLLSGQRSPPSDDNVSSLHSAQPQEHKIVHHPIEEQHLFTTRNPPDPHNIVAPYCFANILQLATSELVLFERTRVCASMLLVRYPTNAYGD